MLEINLSTLVIVALVCLNLGMVIGIRLTRRAGQ